MENRKEFDFKRIYAYESFVHATKGPTKMGVKRSRRRLRSSQSCHPDYPILSKKGIHLGESFFGSE